MDFRKKYINAKDEELMFIIDSPEMYISECIEVVKDIFSMRILDEQEIENIAVDINTQKVRDEFNKIHPAYDDIKMRESYFLSKELMKQLYLLEFDLWVENKKAFDFDVWAYAIGGF